MPKIHKVHFNGIEYEGASAGDYEGELVDGIPNGKGKMTYANRDVYDGEWKDDKKHGKGTQITWGYGNFNDGQTVTYENDKLVSQGSVYEVCKSCGGDMESYMSEYYNLTLTSCPHCGAYLKHIYD